MARTPVGVASPPGACWTRRVNGAPLCAWWQKSISALGERDKQDTREMNSHHAELNINTEGQLTLARSFLKPSCLLATRPQLFKGHVRLINTHFEACVGKGCCERFWCYRCNISLHEFTHGELTKRKCSFSAKPASHSATSLIFCAQARRGLICAHLDEAMSATATPICDVSRQSIREMLRHLLQRGRDVKCVFEIQIFAVVANHFQHLVPRTPKRVWNSTALLVCWL